MVATARIDELRARFEENPRRYFAPLANEYRKAGDAGTAVAICRTQLARYPGHMSGHVVLGQALYETGRLDEAHAAFADALELDPENLIALRHLGDIARAREDAAGARHWYERILASDPYNEEVADVLAALAPPPSPSGPTASDASEPGPDLPFAGGAEFANGAEFVDGWEVASPEPAADAGAGGASASEFVVERPATPAPLDALDGLEALDVVEAVHAAQPLDSLDPLEWTTLDLELPLAPSTPPLDPGVPEEVASEPPLDSLVPEGVAVVGLDLPPSEAVMPPVLEEHLAPPELAGAFVTETMAGLLLQQGHQEQALAVYERLVAQRPDDHALRARLARLRERSGRDGEGEPGGAGGGAVLDRSGSHVALAPAIARPPEPDPAPAPPRERPGVPTFPDVLALREEALDGSDVHAAARLGRLLAGWRLSGASGEAPALLAELEAAAAVRASSGRLAAPSPDAGSGPGTPVDEFSFDRFFVGATELPATPATSEPTTARVSAPEIAIAAVPDVDSAPVAGTGGPAGPEREDPAAGDSDPDADLAEFNAWLRGLAAS